RRPPAANIARSSPPPPPPPPRTPPSPPPPPPPPLGANETCRHTPRPNEQLMRRYGGRQAEQSRFFGFGLIDVVEIIPMQGSDRVGMEHEPAFAGHVPDDRLGDSACRQLVLERTIRVDADDHKAAERFDRR